MRTTVELGGSRASWIDLPRVPLEGRAPPPSLLTPPAPISKRPDIVGSDSLWPASYKVLPDRNGRSRVVWHGTSNTRFPWGLLHRSETLRYEVDDADPADATDIGDALYAQTVGAHTLTWRSHLSVRSDAHDFHYRYTRELLRDGRLIVSRTWRKTIPRDHQ